MSPQTKVSLSKRRAPAAPSTHDHHRMLGPTAYSEALLPSLRLARSSRLARRIGKALLASLVAGLILVAFAPWQQSVTGNGRVIAFDPSERPQTIEVLIEGRIVEWGPNAYENAHVAEGDLIAEVQDVDPNFLGQLQQQLTNYGQVVNNAGEQFDAAQDKRDRYREMVISQQAVAQTYRESKREVLASADAGVDAAKNKVDVKLQKVDEARAALVQLKADYLRQSQLYEEGIVSGYKKQVAQSKFEQAQAKVAGAEDDVKSAENDVIGKQRDRDAKEQEADGKIAAANAYVENVQGYVAAAESEMAKAQSALNKARNSYSEMEIKLSRQQSQRIVAPFDGFLTSIEANMGSRYVKKGDALCVIVPDTKDRAVEVLLDGNDAPLVEAGRHVRLQFEGWPAVQFAGWPSVAVGTFGGTVVSVTAKDNGKGKFRALVRPDVESSAQWPNERYLRQGVQAHSWVLLEQVPLWYEVWRRMNGFPPAVTQAKEGPKLKKPKLPK